jgi:hypothetical protein
MVTRRNALRPSLRRLSAIASVHAHNVVFARFAIPPRSQNCHSLSSPKAGKTTMLRFGVFERFVPDFAQSTATQRGLLPRRRCRTYPFSREGCPDDEAKLMRSVGGLRFSPRLR